MCGIIGLLSNDTAIDFLIQGLQQLQNRGYDSVGIAGFSDNTIIYKKYASVDNVNALEKLETEKAFFNKCHIGIGHTRWATHGAKTDTNSHPHYSMEKNFVLVHNGIIENFREIKEMLQKEGFIFNTETDTEIIANLLEYNLKKDEQTKNQNQIEHIKEIIKTTVSQLQGTWGLAILYKDTPNTLYITRNGSPILIGKEESFVALSSEASGFTGKVKSYFCLENNDICSITRQQDNTFSLLTEKNYRNSNIKNNIEAGQLSPDPYPHWTIKEIEEQPDSILRATNLGGRLMSNNSVRLGGLEENLHLLENTKNIILLGCGTSYNSALYSLPFLKKFCNFNTVQAFDGAEFELVDIPKIGETAFILVSQSGETKDLHRCIELIEPTDSTVIGVVNVPDSLIARESHCGSYLYAGREVAVASTKAFSSQIIVLSLITIWFSQKHNLFPKLRTEYIKSLRQVPTQVQETIEMCRESCQAIAKQLVNKKSIFILGKNKSYPIAREGSLKIKEITYIHAEGYSGSSLKHGPFGLLELDFPVIILAPKDETYAKMTNVYEEVLSRKAKVYFITDDHECTYPNRIVYPSNKHFNYLLSVIPLQLLAYYIAIEKGYNPDFPRNLAKVVTVE